MIRFAAKSTWTDTTGKEKDKLNLSVYSEGMSVTCKLKKKELKEKSQRSIKTKAIKDRLAQASQLNER